jgi:fucose 4-O-acetylase-like acetyltransferase
MKVLPDSQRATALRAALFTALLIAGVYAARTLWLSPTPWGQLLGLPFSGDLAGITLFFFWLGFEFGRRQEAIGPRLRFWWPAVLAVFAALHVFFDYTIDLNYRRYDHLLVSTLMAVSGIALVIGFSQLLVRYMGGRMVIGLEYLGRASLVIFIFHVFLQAKSLFVAIEILHLPYWPAHALAFVGGVVAPVIVYEIIRRVPPLKAVYMPA